MSPGVALSKYHGLGNDFLVSVDSAFNRSLAPSERAGLAAAACNRHTGVGADGLLFVLETDDPTAAPAHVGGAPQAQVAMRLHNADGSRAEMSGNGIRCFSQALVDAGIAQPGSIVIATDGGVREVVAGPTDPDGIGQFSVSMGLARAGTIDIPESVKGRLSGSRFLTVDIGNPHIVIERDPATVEIANFGPLIEGPFLPSATQGINVEVVGPTPTADSGQNTLEMVVWERGVGVTQACGTGACASAVAADIWGLTRSGASTTVRMPGGAVGVQLETASEFERLVTLIGPSQFICSLAYSWVR